MDNSAFEFEQRGRGIPVDSVVKAALKINPSEICVPDILFDGPATVDSVKDFMKWIENKYPDLYESTQFMAIPQGTRSEEWLDCYHKLVEIDSIDTIGFSKLGIPEAFLGQHHEPYNCTISRSLLAKRLFNESTTPDIFGKQCHLLGSDNAGPSELTGYIEKGYDKWIRSNDTSMPYMYGLTGNPIDEKLKRVEPIVMKKLDFSLEHSTLLNEQKQTIDHNFKIWRAINEQ
jgi:hypothetical protein